MSKFRSSAFAAAVSALALSACASEPPASVAPQADGGFVVTGTKGTPLRAVELATFDSPWAMTFLPDGRALVTEKGGAIWLLDADGSKAGQVSGGTARRSARTGRPRRHHPASRFCVHGRGLSLLCGARRGQ